MRFPRPQPTGLQEEINVLEKRPVESAEGHAREDISDQWSSDSSHDSDQEEEEEEEYKIENNSDAHEDTSSTLEKSLVQTILEMLQRHELVKADLDRDWLEARVHRVVVTEEVLVD